MDNIINKLFSHLAMQTLGLSVDAGKMKQAIVANLSPSAEGSTVTFGKLSMALVPVGYGKILMYVN